MGLRKRRKDAEPLDEERCNVDNMGTVGGTMTIGAEAAQFLKACGMACCIIDKDGYVRFIHPSRVMLNKPQPEDVLPALLQQGMPEEDIHAVLEKMATWGDDPSEWEIE
tara:strand:- start:124 stop:450 length:327 start_codon:yes stop_codon:yes gene_type:complete